jgi:hypothetical protein
MTVYCSRIVRKLVVSTHFSYLLLLLLLLQVILMLINYVYVIIHHIHYLEKRTRANKQTLFRIFKSRAAAIFQGGVGGYFVGKLWLAMIFFSRPTISH